MLFNDKRSASLCTERKLRRNSLANDAVTAEGRAEVARAVNARVSQLRLPAAELARLSGLSVNTVRGVTDGSGNYTKSTLVALSSVLDWDPQHLDNILHGKADKNVTTESSVKTRLAELARKLTEAAHRLAAEISAVRQDVARLAEEVTELTGVVHRVDGKTEIIIRTWIHSGDTTRTNRPMQD